MKTLKTILLVASSALAVSCYQVYPPATLPTKKPKTNKTESKSITDKKQRELEQSRDRIKTEEKLREGRNQKPRVRKPRPRKVIKKPAPTAPYTPSVDPTPIAPKPKPVAKKSPVRFAAPVPGKAGFVFNPYTQNQVDVRGIPSGTKVKDPHDSQGRVFRVP